MSKPIFTVVSEEKRTYTGLMSESTTPLVDEIKEYELSYSRGLQALGRVNIISFLEGGDATVRFLGDMATTTPTLSGCNNLYKTYLGRRLTVKRQSSDFDIGEDEMPITLAQSKQFINTLTAMLGGKEGIKDLKKAIQKAALDMLVYGNACVEIIRKQKGKAKGARIRELSFTNFRYENTEDINELGNWAIRCEDFLALNYDPNVTFQKYAVFPNFSEFEDGTERSIYHIKQENADRFWYGLPYSTGALYSIYLEYQLLKYSGLSFDKRLLPTLALIQQVPELANKDTKEENRQKLDRFNRNYTANGSNDARDILGVLPITYPSGENNKPPQIVPIQPTADSKYFEWVANDCQKKIRSTCGVNEILIEKGGNNLSGGNALYQAALAFYSVNVIDFKEQILPLFNDVIEGLFEWVGYANSDGLIIDLKPPQFLETFESFSEQKMMVTQPANKADNKPSVIPSADKEDPEDNPESE